MVPFCVLRALLFCCAVLATGRATTAADRRHPMQVEHRLPHGQLATFVGDQTRLGKWLALADGKAGLSVMWSTDGRQLVRSVYDADGDLSDCDIQHNVGDIRQLVSEVDSALTTGKTRPAGDDARSAVDVQARADECRRLYRHRVQQTAHRQEEVELVDADSNPDAELDAGEAADDQQQQQQQLTEVRTRSRRSVLIWPGTNWCGKGSKAEFAGSLGVNAEADQCCKKHDQCPYIIDGFSTRYNLFNYRIHTLSHCDCDIQFMDCLKSANTSTSHMVAKVYFNVVNTECFDLKLQKSCARRSWWGSCEKYTTKWTAQVRSLGKYND